MASRTIVSLTLSSTSTSTATPSCISVTPDPSNGYVPEYACSANYNYSPSLAAAILFAVLFGLTLALHLYQAITSSKLRVCWVIIMGASWEFVSYALRAAGALNQQSVPISYASQILVLLAPLWLNAFDYMVLGRMINFFLPGQKIWRIRAAKLAVMFVWLDVLSFLTQLGGGSLISPSNDPNTLMIGIHIYMGGIGLQQLFILIFTGIALRFRFLMLRHETNGTFPALPSSALPGSSTAAQKAWRPLLYALLASLTLITIRIIYRLVEFAAGINPDTNPLPYHEWFFYVFDALPMLAACVLMNIVHPGRVLVGEGSEFPKSLSRLAKKAKKMEKTQEKLKMKEEKRAEKEGRKAGVVYSVFDGRVGTVKGDDRV